MSQGAWPWWRAATAISQPGIIHGPKSCFSFAVILLFFIVIVIFLDTVQSSAAFAHVPVCVHKHPSPPNSQNPPLPATSTYRTTSTNAHSGNYALEYNTLCVLMTLLNIPLIMSANVHFTDETLID